MYADSLIRGTYVSLHNISQKRTKMQDGIVASSGKNGKIYGILHNYMLQFTGIADIIYYRKIFVLHHNEMVVTGGI